MTAYELLLQRVADVQLKLDADTKSLSDWQNDKTYIDYKSDPSPTAIQRAYIRKVEENITQRTADVKQDNINLKNAKADLLYYESNSPTIKTEMATAAANATAAGANAVTNAASALQSADVQKKLLVGGGIFAFALLIIFAITALRKNKTTATPTT
jgi:hypothetical protein